MNLHRKSRRWLPIPFVVLGLLLTASAPAVVSAASADHLVTQISLAPRTPNVLQLNESVTVSFSYNTTEAGGVRIFVRPWTDGDFTPHYSYSGSPPYPVGSGTGTANFTITSGDVTVDHVSFAMWDDSQTSLLYQALIPVHYRFTSATNHLINHIGLTQTPNVLKDKQKVSVSFTYQTTSAAGVRIYVRPLTGGSPSPHDAASPSPLYPVGSRAGRGWFTVTSGITTVTQVRLTMWNANHTTLLFQAVLPVSYQFREPANIVNSISLTPMNANILRFGEYVELSMRYTTNEAGGVRIFARPFTKGALTPHHAAHGSPLYPVGSGAAASGFFTINDGTVTVDHIRIQMWNANHTMLLFQAMIPVSYQFK